jgi:RimJ/RimL family protein N-acetyltransferase
MRTRFSSELVDIPAASVTLVAVDRQLARAILIAAPPPEAQWPDDYPTEGSLACATAVMVAIDEGRSDPFGSFCIVRRRDGLTIGDALFHGGPDERGTVDIGYGLVPSARGHGHATDAVTGMIGWAFTRPSVARVTANTTDDNVGSVRVMERAGMTISHGPGGLVRGVAVRGFWAPPGPGATDGPGTGD